MIKHGRKTNRLLGYDYSQCGHYFITTCVNDRCCVFGDVDNFEMKLNNLGRIVKNQWLWLAKQYSYVELDEFVVMPNHVHGIIINNQNHVGTGRDLSLRDAGLFQSVKIKPLPELVGAFKTTSSKLIHEKGVSDFKWQRSYYDHIICDDDALDNIREYIMNNPVQWEFDRNNPKNCI
jgi:putative transposase